MFGHSTVMFTQEIRQTLPCDEALWSATSIAEASRVQRILDTDSLKPTSFSKGVQKLLHKQEVPANSFARTILMAGLLNLSWHMNQDDFRDNALHLPQPDDRRRWKLMLACAFDQWKQDFDKTSAALADEVSALALDTNEQTDSHTSQYQTALYHLAHMSVYADIVLCQAFARAPRLLGHVLNEQDFMSTERVRKAWALSWQARKATLHAFQFLFNVLLPVDGSMEGVCDVNSNFQYSTREDLVLDRPWILYLAALIVWCYGHAREGPPHAPTLDADDSSGQLRDMKTYLRKFGGIQSPEQLEQMEGVNGCRGMLMVLCSVFEESVWNCFETRVDR